MAYGKHRNFLVGLILSVLVSLFVNFLLMMRGHDPLFNSLSETDKVSPFVTFSTYFALVWFFLFSYVIFIVYEMLFSIADRIFKSREVMSFLFATLLSLSAAFGLFRLYPGLHRVISIDVLELTPPVTKESMFLYEDKGEQRLKRMEGPPPPAWAPPPRSHFLFRPLFTEHLFVMLTVMLCVLLLRQLRSKQEMMLAYEKLKAEKLQTSYNALMGQINPHFFFNSLNGLNSLIRSGEKEQTLQYLDELSNVFRYILQSNHKELVSLSDELQFVKAYTYLLEVRYEGKLFFSIQIDPAYLFWNLPILSVLPLIENAVKHNVISKQSPLRIDIYTSPENLLVVSNKIQPKVEDNAGAGIGLKNLWGRYKMLTGRDIYISSRKEYFNVSLPLIKKNTHDETDEGDHNRR